MTRVSQGMLLVLLLLGRSSAYAFDGDFYTYEGFSQTVNAFKVISLIFHDNQFKVLVSVFATIGLFGGGFISFVRAVFNGGQSVRSAISWMFWPIFGCVIYQALVFPKGNIHIYDKVSNQYQAIGNIPNILVGIATVFNNLEEGLRKIVAKNSASPRAKEVSGVSFRLFYNTMMGASNTTNLHYTKSIKRFYNDCMPVSNVIEPKFDLERLLKDTPNIFDELQHLWHPSIFTVFYGEKRRGETMCCTDAWNKLFAWINNPGNFQGNFVKICKRQGFSKPEQIPACKKEIDKAASFLFDRPVSSDMLLRNAIFAHNIAKSLTDSNPDIQVGAYSNRKLINSGLASATAAQTWMPTIKATMTAIVLSLMPFLVLLFVTPLFPKALALVFSLFAWLTIWGVCDAILHQAAIDQMISAFEGVRSFKMGLWALWTAPTAAIKALAIMSQARTLSATIAGLIGSAVLGFSFHSFGAVSGALTGRVESEGAAAADRTQEPERAADYMEGIARANAVTNTVGQQGWGAFQGSKTSEESQRVARAQGMTGGSSDYSGAGQRAGRVEGAETRGRTEAMGGGSQDLEAVARQTAHTETSQRVGGAQGVAAAASGLGQNIQGMQQGISETETLQRHAGAEVAQEINQQIGEHNPEYPLDQLWREQVMLQSGAQAKAMVEASGGNSDHLQSVLTTQAQENLAGTEARQATAAGMGLTAPGMRRDAEKWNTMQAYERNRALEAGADALGMDQRDFVKAVNRNGLVSVTLSPEQLRAAHEKNPLAIPESTFKIFEQTGARLQSGITNHGTLVDMSLSANTTASNVTALDNSLNLGNPASARSTLTNPFMVEKILATKGEDALVQASADSLKGIVNVTHQNSTHAGVNVGAKAGANLGVIGGSVDGSLGKNWSDQQNTNALYGDSRALLNALKVESQQGISPGGQSRWVSEHYAKAMTEVQSYYMQDSTKDSVSARSAWEGAKEMVGKVKEGNLSATNPFEQYLKKQKFTKGQEAFKARVTGDKGGHGG